MKQDASGSTQEQQIGSSLEPPVHGGLSFRKRRSTADAGAVILRSQQSPVTLGSLEDSGAQNQTFRNFRARLAAWLTHALPVYGFSFAPGYANVEFQADDMVSLISDLVFWLIVFKITEYRSMKVCYESQVDWHQYLDFLYCSPDFFKQERRDFVILRTADGFIFAKLAFVFTASVGDRQFPICLAQPLDASLGEPRAKDRKLGLHRLRAKPSMEFFFAQSIVRGAPLIPAPDKHGDYILMDVVDHTGDLYIRCNEIFGRQCYSLFHIFFFWLIITPLSY